MNSTEMRQIDEYDTFMDLGKYSPLPVVYRKIWVHLLYDVKNYGCHKARLVAGGVK